MRALLFLKTRGRKITARSSQLLQQRLPQRRHPAVAARQQPLGHEQADRAAVGPGQFHGTAEEAVGVHQATLGVAKARGPLASDLLAVASRILVVAQRFTDDQIVRTGAEVDPNAEAMLGLRVARANHLWDPYWTQPASSQN
ncbi:MAG: hypothetical protein AAB466_00510 [Verrucomicrobiota bacterium]